MKKALLLLLTIGVLSVSKAQEFRVYNDNTDATTVIKDNGPGDYEKNTLRYIEDTDGDFRSTATYKFKKSENILCYSKCDILYRSEFTYYNDVVENSSTRGWDWNWSDRDDVIGELFSFVKLDQSRGQQSVHYYVYKRSNIKVKIVVTSIRIDTSKGWTIENSKMKTTVTVTYQDY